MTFFIARRPAALLVALIGIIALGCANQDAEAQQAKNSATKAKTAATATANGAQVYALKSVQAPKGVMLPDFSWTMNGKDVKFSEYTKGKTVFLNYWATWCPPCRREIPDIVELAKEYGDKVVFIGIALENESTSAAGQKLVSAFATKNGMNYINLVAVGDIQGPISALYNPVEAIPTTFIFGKDGKIAQRIDGSTNKESFLMELKKAM
jgi:thiol-disulfide isomerase/thioredoxin